MCMLDNTMVMFRKNIIITTPAFYPNSQPHLGTWLSFQLSRVVHWMFQSKHCLLTGTDEHGSKVLGAAVSQGQEVSKFVDMTHLTFKRLFYQSYSELLFYRTSSMWHKRLVRGRVLKWLRAGILSIGMYQGYYDVREECFFNSPAQGRRYINEKNLFIKMTDCLKRRLLRYIIKHVRVSDIRFIKEGLEYLRQISEICITRKCHWGIRICKEALGEERTVYVWLDALSYYFFGQPGERYVHVIGHDIFKFHFVLLPLIYLLDKRQVSIYLLIHGWVMLGGRKMSKSYNNTIAPMELSQNELGIYKVIFLTSRKRISEDISIHQDIYRSYINIVKNKFYQNWNRLVPYLETGEYCSAEHLPHLRAIHKALWNLNFYWAWKSTIVLIDSMSSNLNTSRCQRFINEAVVVFSNLSFMWSQILTHWSDNLGMMIQKNSSIHDTCLLTRFDRIYLPPK